MSLDHEAIRKAYPNAVTINDSTGAFDANGNAIALDNSLVTVARTTLDNEANATFMVHNHTSLRYFVAL